MIAALYEDEEILVVDKPAGLASQPGADVRISLVEAVERDFGFRPFLVHRLDKETSGCVIVAKSARAAGRWSALVESRELEKKYRAVVAGRPPGANGVFDAPIRTREGEKAARTVWRSIAPFGEGADDVGFGYLELVLDTGRMHQIRIHLAGAGLPILGDDRHGDFALNKRLKKAHAVKRLLLHARSLSLPDGRRIVCPLPEHFRDFLARWADAPDPEAP